jgi:hypothetical protein
MEKYEPKVISNLLIKFVTGWTQHKVYLFNFYMVGFDNSDDDDDDDSSSSIIINISIT